MTLSQLIFYIEKAKKR